MSDREELRATREERDALVEQIAVKNDQLRQAQAELEEAYVTIRVRDASLAAYKSSHENLENELIVADRHQARLVSQCEQAQADVARLREIEQAAQEYRAAYVECAVLPVFRAKREALFSLLEHSAEK